MRQILTWSLVLNKVQLCLWDQIKRDIIYGIRCEEVMWRQTWRGAKAGDYRNDFPSAERGGGGARSGVGGDRGWDGRWECSSRTRVLGTHVLNLGERGWRRKMLKQTHYTEVCHEKLDPNSLTFLTNVLGHAPERELHLYRILTPNKD